MAPNLICPRAVRGIAGQMHTDTDTDELLIRKYVVTMFLASTRDSYPFHY